ncbi:MAG: M15 family metallopeptidase, partial [Acetatifactor sp.]|nr:M15 family metallopeptidase [Acetatifactor sp.]
VQEEEVSMEDLDSWEEELYWEEEEIDSLQEDAGEEQINLEDILSYRREQEGYEEAVAAAPGQQSGGETEFSLDDWRLILVNKQHPIPQDYDFTLATIKGSQQCDERIIDDLLAMMQAAKDAGFNLLIQSPYRSDARQEWLFDRKIKLFMGKGMSYMDAFKRASQVVMVPDSSEHQIGLSLDIVCDYYESLTQGFGETQAGIWLEEHCAEFGFIVRYPRGKEYITSVEYEPWHFRYVGVDAATIIMEQGLTLEEFVEDLK